MSKSFLFGVLTAAIVMAGGVQAGPPGDRGRPGGAPARDEGRGPPDHVVRRRECPAPGRGYFPRGREGSHLFRQVRALFKGYWRTGEGECPSV